MTRSQLARKPSRVLFNKQADKILWDLSIVARKSAVARKINAQLPEALGDVVLGEINLALIGCNEIPHNATLLREGITIGTSDGIP